MLTQLSLHAEDEGTYAITASFTDEDGDAVIPTALTWTLTDASGTVINSRTAVVVTPAASVTVVLSGNDLKYSDGRHRIITFEGTYTSDLGSGLPFRNAALFTIDDI